MWPPSYLPLQLNKQTLESVLSWWIPGTPTIATDGQTFLLSPFVLAHRRGKDKAPGAVLSLATGHPWMHTWMMPFTLPNTEYASWSWDCWCCCPCLKFLFSTGSFPTWDALTFDPPHGQLWRPLGKPTATATSAILLFLYRVANLSDKSLQHCKLHDSDLLGAARAYWHLLLYCVPCNLQRH